MLRVDQETVDSLPRLADVYDAYGVEVNALSVEEIFALYERTGFLYPDKAARLFPHLPQVRENWRRMLSAGESLLYVLTAGDKKRGQASLAVWRSTRNGWMSQHLVSENNPYASRAGMLASQRLRSFGAELVSAGEPVSSTRIRLNGTDHRRTSFVGAETCVFCVAENTLAAGAKANSHCAIRRFSSRVVVGDRFSGTRKHLHNRGRVRTRCGICGRG